MTDSFEIKEENSIGFLIGRARRTLANQINRSFMDAGIDLNIEQWIILKKLWIKDGQTQQEIAKNVYKDKACITRTLAALIQRNLIVKIPDKSDKRNKLIYLTNQGENMKMLTLPHIKRAHDNATKGISDGDLELCKKILVKVFENVNNN